MKVYGDPDVELNVDVSGFDDSQRGASQLTAARVSNSIPAVCAARPAVLTYLDVPIPRIWR